VGRRGDGAGRTHEQRRCDVGVAGFASAIAALVTPNLTRLADQASLEIIEAEDAVALRELRLGYVDVAIIQEYAGDHAQRDQRLTYALAARDELRLVLPSSSSASTTIADLDGMPWLMNGTGTRCEAMTREILRAAGIDAKFSGNVSDNHVLLQLVATGHGATSLPDLVLRGLGEAVVEAVTVAREPLGVTRTLLAVTRKRPTTAALAVVDALTGAAPAE
jgi:DNA-binding transcriptional LysR family regulator